VLVCPQPAQTRRIIKYSLTLNATGSMSNT